MKTGFVTGRAPTTALSFTGMFFLGLGIALIGASAQNAGISADRIGILITVQQLGFLSSVALAGKAADRRSKTLLLTLGAVLVAVGFFFFFVTDIFLLNVAMIFLAGIGIGIFEAVTDALLVDTHRARASVFITLNHFFVVAGMLVITIYMIYLRLEWRAALVQSSVILMLLAIAGVIVKDPPGSGATGTDWSGFARLLGNRTTIKLFVATTCALGVETGTVGILSTYLVDLRAVDPDVARFGLVVFLGAYAVGRAVVGPAVSRGNMTRWSVFFSLVTAVAVLGVYLLRAPVAVFVAIGLAGLSITNILPLLINIAGRHFPEAPGTAMGILKLGIPAGGVVVPFLLSVITTSASLSLAIYLFPLTALIGFLVVLTLPPEPAASVQQ